MFQFYNQRLVPTVRVKLVLPGRVLLIEAADGEVFLHGGAIDVDPALHPGHACGEEPLVGHLHPAQPLPPLSPGPLSLPDRGDAAPPPHQGQTDCPQLLGGHGETSQADGVQVAADVEQNLHREARQQSLAGFLSLARLMSLLRLCQSAAEVVVLPGEHQAEPGPVRSQLVDGERTAKVGERTAGEEPARAEAGDDLLVDV